MLADFPKESYTVKDVPASDFVKAYADHLKKTDKVDIPKVIMMKIYIEFIIFFLQWIDYVKTGIGRELAPTDQDWLYIRIGLPKYSLDLF